MTVSPWVDDKGFGDITTPLQWRRGTDIGRLQRDDNMGNHTFFVFVTEHCNRKMMTDGYRGIGSVDLRDTVDLGSADRCPVPAEEGGPQDRAHGRVHTEDIPHPGDGGWSPSFRLEGHSGWGLITLHP